METYSPQCDDQSSGPMFFLSDFCIRPSYRKTCERVVHQAESVRSLPEKRFCVAEALVYRIVGYNVETDSDIFGGAKCLLKRLDDNAELTRSTLDRPEEVEVAVALCRIHELSRGKYDFQRYN